MTRHGLGPSRRQAISRPTWPHENPGEHLMKIHLSSVFVDDQEKALR
ncbi:hypothetical protein HCK01_34740, partial [Streptomyces sp. AA8]|nr:hypothetical protein [Streptomyces telluris]